MAEKLLFKKKVLNKKDIQETVYTNCSLSSSPDPGVFRIRHLGKTMIHPQRNYLIPYKKEEHGQSLLKQQAKQLKSGLLVFSIANCPRTIWWEGAIRKTFPACNVFFAPPGCHGNILLHNQTFSPLYRYYFIVERNIHLEMLFHLSEAAVFEPDDAEKSFQCAETLFYMAENGEKYSEKDLSLKLFEFLTFLKIPKIRQRDFTGPYREKFNLVAGYPADYPTMESLKELFRLSEKTLIKLFHTYTGRSPMGFVIYHRLYNSCWQLTETTIPIEEVAFLAGYSSNAFYSKAFKAQFGVSPSQYRKNTKL